MTTDTIMVSTRAGVLLLCAVGGLMCIYLGWRLYRDAVLVQTKAEFEGGTFKLRVATAGPGVFKVALGIYLLVGIANRPLQIQDSSPVKESTKSSLRVPKQNEGGFVLTANAPAAPTAATSSAGACPATDCLLKKRTLVFGTGASDLTAGDISKIASDAALLLSKPGASGTAAELAQRGTLVGNLKQLAEIANESR